MTTLYRELAVLRQDGPRRCVRYVCVEDLDTGLFTVLLADFHQWVGRGVASDFGACQQMAMEVFIEQEFQERAWAASLEAAIEQHDADFADLKFP